MQSGGIKRNRGSLWRPWVILVLLAGAFYPGKPCLPATMPNAAEVVENLHGTLLVLMKGGRELGFKGRYDRLAPVVDSSFDFPFISKTVLGKTWDSLSANQKAAFLEAFRRLSISTYAANFDSFSGERFVTLSDKKEGDRMVVRTKLVQSSGVETPFDYVMQRSGESWRIINVIADGVSDLALKRSDYNAFLKKNGVDALIRKINEKAAEYAQ